MFNKVRSKLVGFMSIITFPEFETFSSKTKSIMNERTAAEIKTNKKFIVLLKIVIKFTVKSI